MKLNFDKVVTRDHLTAVPWLFIGLSTLVYVSLPVGESGRMITVGLFDFAVVGLFCFALLRGQLPVIWPMTWAFVLVGGLLAYAGLMFVVSDTIQVAGLVRETIKYCVFVVLLAMCLSLLAGRVLGPLYFPPLLLIGAVVLFVWWLYISRILGGEVGGLVVNVYSNVALGLAVLMLQSVRTNFSGFVCCVILIYQVIVFAFCVWAGAVANAGVTLLLVSVTGLVWFKTNTTRRTFILSFCAVAFATIAAAGIVYVTYYDATRSPTGLVRSGIVIRLALWLKAFDLMHTTSSLGIGPGQFGLFNFSELELVRSLPAGLFQAFGFHHADLPGPYFGDMKIRYVHNTFGAMLVEWGLVGIGLSIALLVLVVNTARRLWAPAAFGYVLYALPTLLLNDGIGFRMHILILSVGAFAWLTSRTQDRVP